MTEKLNSQLLKEELENIGEGFEENELAYRALTRKIEPETQGNLSFKLHRRLSPQNFLVIREWEGIDIAILKNSNLKTALEIKAMFTYDGTEVKTDVEEFPKKMIKDLESLPTRSKHTEKIDWSNIHRYSILIATHPLSKIENPLRDARILSPDYIRNINKAFEKIGAPEETLDKCKRNIESFFKERDMGIEYGIINAGECFGIEVRIPFWVIGPVSMSEKLR